MVLLTRLLFLIQIQVEFSDESDVEINAKVESKEKTTVVKKRSTTRRVATNNKTAPEPPVEKVPTKRPARGKRSTASSDDDGIVTCQAAPVRRGRSRRELSRVEPDSMEEPDKMRAIEEETIKVLDMSIEQLRTSDTEDVAASSEGIVA